MEEENSLIDRIVQHRGSRHILFWVGVLFIAPLTSGESVTEMKEAYVLRLVGLPTKMMATYLLVYFQIPQLLHRRKYLQFTLSLVASVIVFTVLARTLNIHLAERLTDPLGERESFGQILRQFKYTVLGYLGRVYGVAFLFLFVKMIKDRSVEKQKLQRLKQEKVTAELNFLKAQIHPHFLFNTLNNLYALTLEKSDQAPEVVAKLADMLDYMLYRCHDKTVPIHQEITLLEHYLDLERLRYGDRLRVDFSQSVDDLQTPIAPLILISIVENAFKHGVSRVIGPAVVTISIVVKDGEVRFRVFNTKPQRVQETERNYQPGIGLQNAQRQLDLLYPNRYQWRTEEQAETYEVNLHL